MYCNRRKVSVILKKSSPLNRQFLPFIILFCPLPNSSLISLFSDRTFESKIKQISNPLNSTTMKKLTFISIMIACFLMAGNINAQNIAISDVSHTADASAVLDVYSTSLGMLIPRLSSAPTSPANGLLYYSTASNSFFYNAGTSGTPSWTELSYGNLWIGNGPDTYLSNVLGNAVVGGTTNPFGYKFYVQQLGPGIISNSRIDGQLEIWNYTDNIGSGDLMLADINDNGGANGIMQLYSGGLAGIRLLANGNSYFNGGSVAVSDASHSADVSAVLDVQSTTKGMLIPRMGTAPLTPANGLMYYNTVSNSFMYNAGTAAVPNWSGLSGGSLWTRTGTDTYLANMGDNVVIGTNTSLPGYKFYVHSPISQMSRFDGQVEFWATAGTNMYADLNVDGSNHGVFNIYDNTGFSRISLLANGNSLFNGGAVCIGGTLPTSLLHVVDNNGFGTPQLLLDNISGGANTAVGYNFSGLNFVHGIEPNTTNFVLANSATIAPPVQGDGITVMSTFPSGIVDLNNQSRTRVFQAGDLTQSIPSSIWQPIDFLTMNYDQQGEWTFGWGSPMGGPPVSYFTAHEEGYYQVNSRTEFFLGDDGFNIAVLQDAYVSIAIYKGDIQGNWNMYAQGNNLQIGGIWNPQFGEPMEELSLKNNNAPNVSDVVYLMKGERIAIYAWQSSGMFINLVPGTAKTYVSIHKSS